MLPELLKDLLLFPNGFFLSLNIFIFHPGIIIPSFSGYFKRKCSKPIDQWTTKWISSHTGICILDFPGKEFTWNVGDLGSIPGLGRSSGEGNSYPLQYSGLENSMDCIVHGVTNSQTQLSNFHREAWRAAVQWVAKSWTRPSDRTTAIYEVDFCTRKIPEHGNKNILQSLNFKHKVLLRKKKKCAEIKISESTFILWMQILMYRYLPKYWLSLICESVGSDSVNFKFAACSIGSILLAAVL